MNELIMPGNLDHGAIKFDEVAKTDLIKTLKEEIAKAQDKIKIFEDEKGSDFDSVFVKLNEIEEPVDRISSIFYSLYELDLTEERMKMAPEISNLLTEFSSSLSLNPKILKKIKECHDTIEEHKYTLEQKEIIKEAYQGLLRNGALLNDQDKDQLKKIDLKLNELRLKFNENSLKATNADFLHLKKSEDLQGLPVDTIEQAKSAAEKKELDGWVITLHAPSYMPFMTYAENRELRRELYLKRGSIAFGGEFDNTIVIQELLKHRFERAQLLGYKNHADYILEKRMAKSSDKVYELLDNLKNAAFEPAQVENESLKDLMEAEIKSRDLQSWDVLYYAEKDKLRQLKFNDEELKPYFKLENVVEGVFQTAEKMYNLTFKERPDLPKYHDEVRVFEVFDQKTKNFIGLFYTDYFPRETKGSGAWCDQFQPQGFMFGKVRRPHVINVGNFNPSTKSKPSLLNFNEVLTLFHEFGHALHTLLSNCHYRSLSGTNVHWDFVELPSQIMENWCYEKECLNLFAKHFETGELIPTELVEKLSRISKFRQAYKIIRQVQFALLDMRYHDNDPKNIKDIKAFEQEIFKDFNLVPSNAQTCMSTNFGHLFGGGYSAGYYSYHWAEVLDADAFEYFKEHGIFDKKIAQKFRTEILERGGTADPTLLYRNFRSQDPSPEALLRRSGLV